VAKLLRAVCEITLPSALQGLIELSSIKYKGRVMDYILQDFKVSYEISSAIAKSGAKGEMNGRAYSSSVKITARNRYEEENSVTNCVDLKEQELIVRILCKDDLTAGVLTTKFNQFFKNKGVLKFNAGLPSFNNGAYTLTTDEDDAYWINFLNNITSASPKK
jgi:hypothetical protein